MEIYFLKSAACLAILMLFYKLLLENENMHVFKRFYLLSAVLVSFVIPSITFTSYVDIPAVPYNNLFEVEAGGGDEPVDDRTLLPFVLWTIYGLGVLFFGIKFFRNLQQILQKIRRNPQIKAGHTTNVLLNEEVAPHTFWSYIFLNRQKYQERRIPAEVFKHEQAHAVQKHSFDILLMELLQVIFWFHPLLYFIKRAIKLNHEFLADRAVLKKGVRTSTYQETLLAFSSGAANSSFVNSINYSSIKKRFTVMKTHTSKKAIWARSLLLLPLLAVLIYSCSTNEELERPTRDPALQGQSQEIATPEMISEYNKMARKYNSQGDKFIEVGAYKNMRQIYDLMSPEQRETAEAFPEVEVEIIEVVEDEKITSQTLAEYNKLAKFYNSQPEDYTIVRVKDFARMNHIFSLMSADQRENAEPFPYNLLPPPPPSPSSPERGNTENGETIPPPPPPPVPETPRAIDTDNLPEPPPSPEEHMRALATEGAEFFYEGKKISSREAINLVDSNKNLRIQVTNPDSHAVVQIFDN